MGEWVGGCMWMGGGGDSEVVWMQGLVGLVNGGGLAGQGDSHWQSSAADGSCQACEAPQGRTPGALQRRLLTGHGRTAGADSNGDSAVLAAPGIGLSAAGLSCHGDDLGGIGPAGPPAAAGVGGGAQAVGEGHKEATGLGGMQDCIVCVWEIQMAGGIR